MIETINMKKEIIEKAVANYTSPHAFAKGGGFYPDKSLLDYIFDEIAKRLPGVSLNFKTGEGVTEGFKLLGSVPYNSNRFVFRRFLWGNMVCAAYHFSSEVKELIWRTELTHRIEGKILTDPQGRAYLLNHLDPEIDQ